MSTRTRHLGFRTALAAVAAVSGWSALVYEVMWQRSVGLVLGATAHATAVVLVGFFAGMAIGSYAFGRLADRVRRPLRLYGALELMIGVAGACFALFWPRLPSLVAPIAIVGAWGLAGKAAVGVGILLPATILMGGTIPCLVRAASADEGGFRSLSGLLYGLNTLGACVGAAVGGLILPTTVGITGAQWVAVGGNVLAGLVAFAVPAVTSVAGPVAASAGEPDSLPGARLDGYAPLVVAGVSGFCMLALEVLWTRMFAQVLHNSVYSFTVILIVFLAALGLGAIVTDWVARRLRSPAHLISLLLASAGLLVLVGNLVFLAWTGMRYFAGDAAWLNYVLRVAALASATVMPMALAGGMVLPLLWRVYRSGERAYGARVGTATLVNTAASATGAIAAGFVLLPALGLWRSIVLIAVIYFTASSLLDGALTAARRTERRVGGMAAALRYATVILAALWLNPAHNPLEAGRGGAAVLFQEEGASGITSVVGCGSDRALLMDRYYTLGGSQSVRYEAYQGHLPLILHPRPRRVCFLGVATGITMGAALKHPCEEVVGVEIVPEVLHALPYFDEWNGGLTADERVHTVVEDGRVYIASTDKPFDVVVGDLYIPWHAGTGYLYTREHFSSVRDHLTSGGLFCQWLPLYQLSEAETSIIIRTFHDVFPQMAVFRCDLLADEPVIALVGWRDHRAVELGPLGERMRGIRDTKSLGPFLSDASGLLMTFMGDGEAAMELARGPDRLNTDAWPWIEFMAPVSHRNRDRFVRRAFREGLMRATPSARNVFSAADVGTVEAAAKAGRDLHIAACALDSGDGKLAAEYLGEALGAPESCPVRQLALAVIEHAEKRNDRLKEDKDLAPIWADLRRERALEELEASAAAARELVEQLQAETEALQAKP